MQRFKKIKLTQGKCALVDTEWFDFLSKFKWFYSKNPKDKSGYARANIKKENGKRGHIKMHHLIFGDTCDHKNGNGLDNRYKNLREANKTQQAWNKGTHAHKKSLGCKGVSIVKDRNGVPAYWIARITVNKKRIYLGTFKSHIAASRAYIKKAKELHGEFARWR